MPDTSLDELGGVATFDVVMETKDMRVSRFTMAPRGVLPWHRHTEIADHFVGLTGDIEVEARDPAERVDLAPGVEFTVRAGRPHIVRNTGDGEAAYLIVQGVGVYDRIPAPPEEA